MTTYDDLPVEVRRANFGWFGEPWWSYICYDEAGKLIGEMRKPFPVGESCLLCGEEFSEAAGDSGQAVPAVTTEGTNVRHVHKECQFMNVAGGLAHHEGRCRCHGGSTETPGMTLRQEALEVWRRTHMLIPLPPASPELLSARISAIPISPSPLLPGADLNPLHLVIRHLLAAS